MRYRYKISYGYAVSLDIYELKLRTFFDSPEKEDEFIVDLKKSKFTKFCLRIFNFLIWKWNKISI